MTANTLLQGQRVKDQGHSVCNRQRRFTAKSVQFSCLFNAEKWACHHVVVARRNFPKRSKTQYFRTKKPENPENADTTPDRLARSRVALELQCFRSCTLSSLKLYVMCFNTRVPLICSFTFSSGNSDEYGQRQQQNLCHHLHYSHSSLHTHRHYHVSKTIQLSITLLVQLYIRIRLCISVFSINVAFY